MRIGIAYFKEDANLFIKNNINLDKIFALSPDAEEILINKYQNVITPLNNKFNKNEITRKLLSINSALEEKINLNIEEDFNKETLVNLFPLIISMYLYIKENIDSLDASAWIYFDQKKLRVFSSSSDLIDIIFKKLIDQQITVFNLKKIKYPFADSLIELINKYIISQDTKGIWLTGYGYKLPEIANKIIKSHPKTSIYFIGNQNKFKLIKTIKNLIKKIFFKNKIIEIIPIYNLNKSYREKLVNILSNNLFIDFESNKGFFDNIISYLDNILEYNYSVNNYILKIIKLTKPKLLIAHQLAIMEPTILGTFFKKNNLPVHLISHGAHRLGNNKLIDFEINRHCRGLLYSKYATHLFFQSKNSKAVFNKLCDNKFTDKNYYKTFDSLPLMWGTKIKKNNKLYANKKVKILHASTFKTLCSRNLIFENSFEYLENLKLLVNYIKHYNNFELVIRTRDLDELNKKLISKLCKNYKNVIISNNNFEEDLYNSDVLVSYSSTTIEEAMYNNRYVAIINFDNQNNLNFDKSLNKLDLFLTIKNLSDFFKKISNHLNTNQKKVKNIYKCFFNDSKVDIDFYIENLFLH